ncbi:MAG: glycosyltransferase family 2 protein [Planctomycetes bacterium]|nr:glycosyltransferase family 2 protein [Planctomycetota bacterium]
MIATSSPDSRPALSIALLSFNRRAALQRTLTELAKLDPIRLGGALEIIVCDNASSDGSADHVATHWPHVHLLRLPNNIGVAGFNRAAQHATSDIILILDDDAWPDPESLYSALSHLRTTPPLGGIMLHRRHPATGNPEWPPDGLPLSGLQLDWPDFGCANLVRRECWQNVGGYEESFFLYRNDTDLALKLKAAGHDVAFNPAWLAWHDSIFASVKSIRWLHLSTRNWIWMSRRHARGLRGFIGCIMGIARALVLARFRPAGYLAVCRAMIEGITQPAPPLPARLSSDGTAFNRLIHLKRTLRTTRHTPPPQSLTLPGSVTTP